MRAAPALQSFLWHSSGLTSTHPCLSCAGNLRAGCSTTSGVSPEQSRGSESPPLTCWQLAFWALCWVMCSFVSTTTCKSFSTGQLLMTSSPSLTSCLGLLWVRCTTSRLDLLNFMRFSWPTSQALPRFLWMTSLPFVVSPALLNFVPANLLKEHLISLSVSLKGTLKSGRC